MCLPKRQHCPKRLACWHNLLKLLSQNVHHGWASVNVLGRADLLLSCNRHISSSTLKVWPVAVTDGKFSYQTVCYHSVLKGRELSPFTHFPWFLFPIEPSAACSLKAAQLNPFANKRSRMTVLYLSTSFQFGKLFKGPVKVKRKGHFFN